MSRWVVVPMAVVAALALAVVIAGVAGAAVWRRGSGDAVARLTAATMTPSTATYPSEEAFHRLPATVQRYFELVLPGDRLIRHATIEWAGSMRLSPDAEWVPFAAVQEFSARPPGFVWDAEVRMMPLLDVRVRDAYVAGHGSMLGRLGGVVPIVDAGDSPELASSALIRWIGEAMWFPTALLPGRIQGLSLEWTAIDDSTARLTVADGPLLVSADFRFAATGEIISMVATRYRDVEGTPIPTPFEGCYFDYVRRDGFLVPGRAEVAWLLPEGRYAYWRGEPVTVAYQVE